MIHPYFKLSLVLAAVCALFSFTGGCKDSQEAKVSQEISQSVNEAQRGISSTKESQGLTQSEVNRALDNRWPAPQVDINTKVSDVVAERMRKQLGAAIAKRLSGDLQKAKGLDKDGQVKLDKNLAELNALLTEALDDGISDADFNALNVRAFANSLLLLEQEQDQMVSDYLSKKSDAKLASALAKLEAATAKVDRISSGELLLAPELTKAAIGLIRLHQAMDNAGQKRITMHTLQDEINRQVLSYIKEAAQTAQIEARRPTASISNLGKVLQKWQTELNSLSEKITDLQTQEADYQGKYDSNFKKAQAINADYRKLMAEADKVRGQERYKLQDSACQLQLSSEGKPGGLYYDSQTEKASANLKLVKGQLAFENERKELLEANVSTLKEKLDQLNASKETTTDIADALAVNTREKSKLAESVHSGLANLDSTEKEYLTLRDDVLGQFGKVTKTLGGIRSMSPDSRDVIKFAKELKNSTIHEVSAFIAVEAGSYEVIGQMLSLVVSDIDKTQGSFIKLITDYNTKSQTAKAKADEMAKDAIEEKPAPIEKTKEAPIDPLSIPADDDKSTTDDKTDDVTDDVTDDNITGFEEF